MHPVMMTEGIVIGGRAIDIKSTTNTVSDSTNFAFANGARHFRVGNTNISFSARISKRSLEPAQLGQRQ